MGAGRKEDKKVNISFRIRQSLIEKIKSQEHYNVYVENVLDKHFKNLEKKDKKE